MGRRQFRQDLAIASNYPPPHIYGVETTDDGEISFQYTYNGFDSIHTANLQLLALNVDDYPIDNEYMIFVRDGDVDPRIVNAFDLLCPIIRNRSIGDALLEVSNGLYQAITSGPASNQIQLAYNSDIEDADEYSAQDDGEEDDDSAEDWAGDDDAAFGFEESKKSRPLALGTVPTTQPGCEDIKKIREDLRQVKDAGFKVGMFGDLQTSGIICVSVRVSKLGISEEVMKAWGLESQQYFVLLLRCLGGYRSFDSVKEDPGLSGSTEIRLGLCSSYKPNMKSAYDAFTEASFDSIGPSQQQIRTSATDLKPLFIGRPLNDLFRTRFTRIVKFREVYCLSWAGAEQLVHDTQGAINDPTDMDRYDGMYDNTERALPALVLADAMSERRLLKHCSLPLVAMQFALRHFVRCTEFCLVCHCSSGSTFEALKPYVCSSPLCLYQYMGLGFGPSIEWEISSQPYVVDLLISFCYAQASAGRLKDFPVGIDLRVPVTPRSMYTAPGLPSHVQRKSIPSDPSPGKSFDAPYNGPKRELLFASVQAAQHLGLKKGDWIALSMTSVGSIGVLYHRIEDIILPSVRLGPAVHTGELAKDGTQATPKPLPDKFLDVECYQFNHSFDDLHDDDKAKSIMALLDTIPSVKEMQLYLETRSTGPESSLRQWRERISPPALNVLRWIIASNRSCIMQVDTVVGLDAAKNTKSSEDRVSGMDEYMQFRFAQGAPDKEQRFIDCVKKHTAHTTYPTLFAWHGSPLANWHSIIREGLHFKDQMHGRAYGHGVYMSPFAQTSIGYTHMNHNGSSRVWPNSELKISSAMSLNEVVNNPASYVSRNPHLVVAETDWIQTRYLLVRTTIPHTKGQCAGMVTIPQDPSLKAVNLEGAEVQIPITAVSKSRRPIQPTSKKDSRKRKSIGSGHIDEPIVIIDSDNESVATTDEDREFLVDDESHSGQTPILLDSDTEMGLSNMELDVTESPKKKMRQQDSKSGMEVVNGLLIDQSKTDFVPGGLDMSDIQILPSPEDASRSASSSLLKAFNALLKTQQTTPAHELGWYVNPEQMENMYQWIVELHSFDKDLPLAQDMETAGVSSVVLEMRFTNSWPFAPPFVRVIKPRFLPFSQRGGGHVTEGGAICMELLTNSGWSAVSSIESVLLQIRLAMSEKEPAARLASESRYGGGRDRVYQVGEALHAYERACRAHGWAIPEAFAKFRR